MKNNIPIRTGYLLILTLMAVAALNSCRSTQPAVDPKDLSYLYNPVKVPITLRYNITNLSDNESELSIKFFDKDLFFSEANPQGVPMASLLVTVKLFDMTQGRTLADTTSSGLNIVKQQGVPEYIYRFPLEVQPGTNYVAEIKVLDRIRLKVAQTFASFNTLSPFNRYCFTINGHFQKNELFNPVLRTEEYINIHYVRGSLDSIYIKYFRPFEFLPDPPSMMLPERTVDYEPDQVAAMSYSDTMPIMFPRKGIYLFTAGRDINEGFTVFNMGPSFPGMNTPEAMIEQLGYLASADEIDSLLYAERPKLALDEFWIRCGGNIDRARELIRIYYTRALYSNYYFTSFKEGWRTERGMIYIIYGPPDKVYKSPDGEAWGYKKPGVKSRWGGRFSPREDYLFFNFRKRENAFSDNDLYLSRSETLVTFWDQAITSWRRGIVYRLDNPAEF